MEEMIDVLDENTGEKTGVVISKNEAHKTGDWHGSIHILIINKDKTKTLFQKRSPEKDLYPSTWDIAVGGHISAGEDALTSAKRELKEELGLDSVDLEIKQIDRIKERFNNNGVISNEFVTIFLIYMDIDISSIKFQVEEISDVRWCSKDDIDEYINSRTIVPHLKEFDILGQILR